MTVEADFRALLVAHAPLTALVGDRVALNALPEGAGYPAVIFTVTHAPEYAVDGSLMTDQCSINAECWGETAAGASAVADLVSSAVAGALLSHGAVVNSRSTGASPDDGLDSEALSITWWSFGG